MPTVSTALYQQLRVLSVARGDDLLQERLLAPMREFDRRAREAVREARQGPETPVELPLDHRETD